MKYFFRILLTLVLAVGVVFGIYYYTNGNPFAQQSDVRLTTVSQQPATEKNANKELLASVGNYKLYKGTTGVILTHGKDEYEFDNWSGLIDAQTPKMYVTDFDGDGNEDLLIRAVSAEDKSSGEFTYDIYVLKPVIKDSRIVKYDVFCADQTTWEDILNNQIREEVAQLKSCKKIIQVSMDIKSRAIAYDNKTGLAKSGYNGYARALQNGSEYMTFQNWTKGKGVYSVNKNKEICIKVEVNINYKNSQTVQTIGYINFKLALNSKQEFVVKEKSMNFKPVKKYAVADPTKISAEKWNYTEHNSFKNTDDNAKVIDWVKYKPEFKTDVLEQTISLAEEETDIKDIQDITVTESYIQLTAKSGFSFDNGVFNEGEYSVIINDGAADSYDIAYTASVMEVNGAQVLKITFDRAYSRSEIRSIEINYGSK